MRCVPPSYLLAVFIAVGLPPITLLNKCFCQVHGNKHKVVNIQLHKAESEKNVCHPAELRDRQPGRREVPLLFGAHSGSCALPAGGAAPSHRLTPNPLAFLGLPGSTCSLTCTSDLGCAKDFICGPEAL